MADSGTGDEGRHQKLVEAVVEELGQVGDLSLGPVADLVLQDVPLGPQDAAEVHIADANEGHGQEVGQEERAGPGGQGAEHVQGIGGVEAPGHEEAR